MKCIEKQQIIRYKPNRKHGKDVRQLLIVANYEYRALPLRTGLRYIVDYPKMRKGNDENGN